MSTKPTSKIDSLGKLKAEMNKLETYCTYQEKLIGYKIEYFQENYNDILSNSLLPYSKQQNFDVNNLLDSVNNLIASILPDVFQGKFMPRMFLKLIEILTIQTFRKTRKG